MGWMGTIVLIIGVLFIIGIVVYIVMTLKGEKKRKEEAAEAEKLRQEVLEENRDEIKHALKEKIINEEVQRMSEVKQNPFMRAAKNIAKDMGGYVDNMDFERKKRDLGLGQGQGNQQTQTQTQQSSPFNIQKLIRPVNTQMNERPVRIVRQKPRRIFPQFQQPQQYQQPQQPYYSEPFQQQPQPQRGPNPQMYNTGTGMTPEHLRNFMKKKVPK